MSLENFDALSDARNNADKLVAQLAANPSMARELEGNRTDVAGAEAIDKCSWTCLWTCAITSAAE